MDDEGGPPEPVGDLDARRRERAGTDPDPDADPGVAMPDDLRELAERERERVERREAERAAGQAAFQRWVDEAGRSGWRRALGESRRDHRAAWAEDGPVGVAGMYLDGGRRWWEISGAVVVALVLALTVLGLVIGVVAGIVGGTYALGRAGIGALVDLGVPQTIYTPITAYLDGHSQGLPITAGQLAGLWLWGEVALLVCGFLGSWGARVGWIVTGAATVAMVWAGTTPHTSRWTAAGVAVLAWSVLSILAFHGAGRGRRLIITSDTPAGRREPGGEDRRRSPEDDA
jgi:hypothetical protein